MDQEISSAIVAAVYLKNFDQLNQIFEDNPEIKVDDTLQNDSYDSVLHIACQNNSVEMLELFLTIFHHCQ